jgi:thioesterase domain-containing protein
LAYEIAHQLIGHDEAVAFVGLIDSYNLSDTPLPDRDAAPEQYLIRILEYMNPTLKQDALQRLWDLGDLDSMITQCHEFEWLPKSVTSHEVRRRCKVANYITTACLRYFPPSLPLDVHLFAAAEPARDDMSNGWEKLLGERLQITRFEGTHMSVMQDEALLTEVSNIVNCRLREVEALPVDAGGVSQGLSVMFLQRGDADGVPVFCFPGAGASVTSFAGLIQLFDPKVPIYGLQPRGLDGASVPHACVRVAAHAWLHEIRAIAPKGPYRLLGHSFGGWLALETARQLQEEGQWVDTVVILDSESPAMFGGEHPGLDRGQVLDRLIEILEKEAKQRLSIRGADLARLRESVQLRELRNSMLRVGLLSPHVDAHALRGMLSVFAANVNTLYAPSQRFDGKVTLIQAAKGFASKENAIRHAEGWKRQARDVSILATPGNHMTMLRLPYVAELGRLISDVWRLPLETGRPPVHRHRISNASR